METRKRFWLALAFAAPLEQLGHALASALNSGRLLEPGRAHLYFMGTLEASAAIAGGGLLAALLPVALARRVHGPMPRAGAWPFLLLAVGLSAVQLELYLAQEVLEGGRSLDIVFRGIEGQLPVALLGAAILHWLSARVGPALAALSAPRLPVLVLPAGTGLPAWPPAMLPASAAIGVAGARAPPAVLPYR